MAVRAAPTLPTPIRPAGSGRQSATVEALRDARDDLRAHNREALDLVDACWPLVSRLELAAIEIGPVAMHTVATLRHLLARYERRHLPDEAA